MADWLIALLGAGVGAGLSHMRDRAKHNEELRSKAYADYLRAVAAAAHLRSDEDERDAFRDAADAKARIAVYGSADVIRNLARFEEAGGALRNERSTAAFVSMVAAMRPHTDIDAVSNGELAVLLLGPGARAE